MTAAISIKDLYRRFVVGVVSVAMLTTSLTPTVVVAAQPQFWQQNPQFLSGDEDAETPFWGKAESTVDWGAQTANDFWGETKSGEQHRFPENADDGSTVTLPGGSPINMHELFGVEAADDGIKNLYGSDREMNEGGHAARDSLRTANTIEGDAYRTLNDSAYRFRPDLSEDPMWESTDTVFGALHGEEVVCDPTRATDLTKHACQSEFEPRLPQECNAQREVEYETRGETYTRIVHGFEGCFDHNYVEIQIAGAPEATFGEPTRRCVNATRRQRLGNRGYYDVDYVCTRWEQDGRVVSGPSSSVLTDLFGDWDYVETENCLSRMLDGYTGALSGVCLRHRFSDGYEVVPNGRNEINDAWAGHYRVQSNRGRGSDDNMSGVYYHFNPFDREELEALDISNVSVSLRNVERKDAGSWSWSVDRLPSAANNWRLRLRLDDSGSGGGEAPCPRGKQQGGTAWIRMDVEVRITGVERVITRDEWSEVPASCSIAERDYAAYCDRVARCTDWGAGGNDCIEIDGHRFCGSELNPPPYDLGRGCMALETVYECNFPGGGVDENFDCAVYEEDPQCGLLTSVCAEDSRDEHGRCFRWDQVYQCGTPGNAGACAVKDFLESDFGDCQAVLIEEAREREVRMETTEVCDEVVALTECTVRRDYEIENQAYTRIFQPMDCGGEDHITVGLTPSWAPLAVEVEPTFPNGGEHARVIEEPSYENGWTARVELACYGADEEDPAELEKWSESVTLRLIGKVFSHTVSENPAEEQNAPSCLRGDDGWSQAQWQCQESGDIIVDGYRIRAEQVRTGDNASELYPGEFAEHQLCSKALARYSPSSQFVEEEFCWEDRDGVEHCEDYVPDHAGLQGECDALWAKVPSGECRYLGMEAVEDGGSGQIQYVWEHKFACADLEHDVYTVEDYDYYEAFECEGGIRCLGDDCVTPLHEKSEDFERALAMLSLLESIAGDIECADDDDPSSCMIFPGRAEECKKAMGGWVNCCETPSGVSLASYIEVLRQMKRLDAAIMNAQNIDAVQGAWSVVRQPVADAWNYTADLFSSAFDTLTGRTQQVATEAAAESVLAQWQQAAMQKTYDFLAQTFGESVANSFFQVSGTGTVTGMAPGIGTALSVIGWAYTIYVLTDLLVNIIWECKDDELQLGVERKLRKTHGLGSYCRKRRLGICLEKRRSFCIFNAPLPRIIQQQARPQLGIGWGSKKNPNCRGLTFEEIERIDWDQVDLDEWVDLLKITGNTPRASEIDIERLTGAGSSLDVEEDNERQSTVERTIERIGDSNLSGEGRRAQQEMWGEN